MFQDVLKLLDLSVRINTDQDSPDLGYCELSDGPFEPVGGPQGQALSPLQAELQKTFRQLVGQMLKLRVGEPFAPGNIDQSLVVGMSRYNFV